MKKKGAIMQAVVAAGMIILSIWNFVLTEKVNKQELVLQKQEKVIVQQKQEIDSKINQQAKSLKYHNDVLSVHNAVLESQEEINNHLNYNNEYTFQKVSELEKEAIKEDDVVKIKKK